jgi:MFS family permease
MEKTSSHQPGPLTPRIWFVLATLAITGQIAWAVENSWFNTFVYDMLTPDPRAVAWMVAVSAIIATLTTLLMGTLSDRTRSRWGRRKPYILIGYILWGVSTIVFPTVAYIKITSIAVIAVILADAVMTFFGSTANDAAFNAWTADVASTHTRGRVEGVLNVSVFIAQIVALVAAGVLIETAGYFTFFYLLGGIVILAGVVAGGLLQDVPLPPEPPGNRPSYWKEITGLFNVDTIRNNRTLFILLLNIMIVSIAFYVGFPYLIIYVENFLGFTKSEFSIIGGAVVLGSALLAFPAGLLADRWDRRKMIIVMTILGSIGAFLFSLATGIAVVTAAAFIWQAFTMATTVASGAWLKDLLPEESRGRFLGIRMIFWVAIPMVIGPAIGSWLIQTYGIPTVENGQAGFIPVPVLFQVTAVIAVLSLIPLLFIDQKKRIES